MKKIILITIFLTSAMCFSQQTDSLVFYRNYYKNHHDLSVRIYKEAYKYEALYKRYLICKRKPKQWKYYKGWSTRIFEKK